RFDQLKARHAGVVGTLFGKDVVLADALDQLLKVTPPVTVATSSQSVRYNPGGDASRSMVTAAKGRPGARLVTIDLSPPPVRGVQSPGAQQEVEAFRQAGAAGGALGILPVADDDELYFQDGSRVYAVSLQSGVPLPGWTQSYPNTNGQYTINCYGYSKNQQYALTLTDTSVLGILGASERLANYGMPVYGSDRGTRLVCLDRATGKERWVARPNKIAEENLRALDFSGSPLVVGDNVYVIGRGGKNYTAEDCYVLCFDVNTGAYKWACFIASANNAFAFNGQMPAGDTLSHLAYSSGRVYILTNIGACAALDAYSGTISWLNIYPRDVNLMEPGIGWRGMPMRQGSSRGSWEFNSVVVQEGKVFILPTDSKHLLVYDAGTGAELKRISTADVRQQVSASIDIGDNALPTTLLGVDGNQVFLTGGKSVYCIDWTKPADSQIVWHCGFSTAIRGRGAVTDASVFVCTESGNEKNTVGNGELWRIDRAKGKRKEGYPARKDWDEGEGPGNVIVVGDQVVVATAKRLNVYADMDLARKRLDDDVAMAPTDPEPRLRYAEVMFVAGQLPVAMEKLDDTVKMLGGLKSLRPGPERDHLFNDCITFATKLQKDKKGDIDQAIDAITKLYDLAASAADADSQQVNYRMSRAKFDRDFVQEDSLATAIRLYQEILTADRLRVVPLIDDEAGGATQAAAVAERMIGEVKKLRPSAYEAVEKLATDALAAAGDDPALLKKVAESYPNSAAAAKAVTAAATAYEAQGNYRLATYTLRQAYNKYGESADKPALLEAMARNYLAMPDRTADRVDTAAARLATIIKLGGAERTLARPLKLPGEKVLVDAGATVGDALRAVQNFRSDAVTARLPDFHLPPVPTDEQRMKRQKEWLAAGADPAKKPRFPEPFVPANQQRVLLNITALVKPPLELRAQYSRHDRIVAWANGSLLLFPVGAADPLGQSNDLASDPRNLAWLNDNAQLLVWSATELALLNGDDLKKKWKLELKGLPKVEVLAGGQSDEPAASQNDNAVAQQQEIIIGAGGPIFRQRRLNGRFIGGGQIVAPQLVPVPQAAANPGAEAIAQVKPVDDRIIVSTTAGQIFAVRTADGTLAWHTRLSSTSPIDRVAATDDFTVAKVDEQTTTQLVILDTLTGQLVRRLTFNNDTGNVPVNFALAADGTLVWIQQDRLCGKDLFDPNRKELTFENTAEGARGPNGGIQMEPQVLNALYAGARNPDQLLISEGRIMVVSHNGKYVSVHSLETGKLLDNRQADGHVAEARLSTVQGDATSSVSDWGVGMQVVGSKLYVCTRQNGPICYNLDKGTMVWGGTLDKPTVPNVQFQEPFIGQDYFVILDRPAPKAGVNPSPNVARLHCYTRAIVDAATGRESGRVGYYPYIHDEAGISDVQGVDGGFYYLTGDKKLHFLKGARP
ncbi:MAG TPA: PQQ-binding-like beta-propeller repeat protein, partial [Tepidisphaeraceae bacterium]